MSDAYEHDRGTGEILEPRRNLPARAEPEARNLIFASAECAEVFGALCEFQGACEPPKKTKTAKVKGVTKGGKEFDYTYSYAPLDEIHNVIRAPMQQAGLAYRQFLATQAGNYVMRTIVAHKTGQWIGCDYPIFQGQQQGAQGFASGVTYARRYGLMLALGIVAEDDDDANVADGQAATVTGDNRSEARPNGAARTPMPRETAAPADADKAEASKRHKELVAAIDASLSIPEIDGWLVSPAWKTFDLLGKRAYPEQHDGVIEKLRARAEHRKTLLRAQAGLPDQGDPGGFGPMTVGEHG